MTSTFENILWYWDIQGSYGCAPKPVAIALMEQFEDHGDFIKASQLTPSGISTAHCLGDFPKFSGDVFLDKVSLIWDVQKEKPLKDDKMFFLRLEDLQNQGISDVCGDFRVSSDTVILPLKSVDCGPLHVLELFSGGVGGWSAALRCLDVPYQVVAVDHDIQACFSFALNFDAILIDGYKEVPPQSFASSDKHFVIHGEVNSLTWLSAVASWSPDLMLVSSPCPSWSFAGHTGGISTQEGSLMCEALGIAKVLRPRAILIEQVSGFHDHPHKEFVFRQIRWAGYSLHWSKVVDAAQQTGTRRSRWLALLIRIGDEVVLPMPFEMWPIFNTVLSPRSMDAILPDDFTRDSALRLTAHIRDISSRLDLLPPSKRQKTRSSAVLDSRCTLENEKTPTFMASYGHQHDFSIDYLSKKGLMAHYFKDQKGEIRFWHPVEILFLHSVVGKFFLPADLNLAWKFLGNQICPPHALLLLANVIRMMPSRVGKISVEKVFQTLHNNRLSACNSFLLSTSFGMFVSPEHLTLTERELASMSEFELMAKKGRLPPGHFWTLNDHGDWLTSEFFRNDLVSHLTSEDPVNEDLGDAVEVAPIVHSPVSQVEVEDSPVSPTLPFCPLLKGVIHLTSRIVEFWFAASLPFDSVLAVWGNQYSISFDHDVGIDVALHLVPTNVHRPFKSSVPGVICLLQEGHLTLFEDNESSRLQALQDDSYFKVDQFGKVDQSSFNSTCVVFKEINPSLFEHATCDPLAIFAASTQVNLETRFDSGCHSWTLEFSGSQTAVDIMGRFWGNLLSDLDLNHLGWKITCRDSMKGTNAFLVAIRFEPSDRAHLIPLSAFQVLIAIAAFRSLVSPLQSADGRRITVKWLSRPLLTVNLEESIGLSVLTRALSIAVCGNTESQIEFRMINAGKRITPECSISDCCESKGKTVIHFVPPCHGGGEHSGSKAGFQTQIRNSIASSLLQEGFDLQWVSQRVDQLFDKIGAKKLAPLAAQPPGSQRLSEILSHIRQLGIEIPQIKPSLSSSHALQSKIRKRSSPLPEAKNYRVKEGTLINEDGSPANQIWDFRNGATGFCLVSADASLPWIRSNAIISSDDLALKVIGESPCETTLEKVALTLPCFDEQNREVLIAVTMFQMGQKKITPLPDPTKHVDISSTALIALTLWKDDWSQEWPQIVKNTTSFIRNVLKQDDAIVAMWGRSFRKGKPPTTPLDATSCQVHCTVQEAKLSSFLQNTGHNLVWATPKTQEGRPSLAFRLIWLHPDIDFPAALVLCAKVGDALGLHKSKDRFAIRVAKSAFQVSWKAIYPHNEPPTDVEASHMFRLEVLPFGTTGAALVEWSQLVKWDLKPFRALGPRSWLVGSPTFPPPSLQFNGSHVLATLLPPKTQHSTNPIVAGPKPVRGSTYQASPSSLTSDPWAAWTGPRLQPAPSLTQSGPRSLPGPVESKLTQQSDRIDKLEQALTDIQAEQAKQGESLQTTIGDIKKNDKDLRQHIEQSLQGVRQELDSSFANALQKQSRAFDSSLQEIKTLLMQNKTKRKSSKQSGEDMSD